MPIKSDPTTWTDPRHRRGLNGEGAAMAFLRESGWRILEHRFRVGRLEVDLVARRGTTVAFIEVKTRWGNAFGSPLEAVTSRKQQEIARVAVVWQDRHGREDDVYRFDVIGVTLSVADCAITHVPDAFRPGWR